MRVDFGLPQRAPGGGGPERPAVLTIGNFDGVHRGHRVLLDALLSAAREVDGESVVMTFDPHPRCVLDPDNCPQQITTLDEKRDLLRAYGVDRLVVLEFTRELSQWTAEHFCSQLVAAMPLRALVVGHDFALGHNRRGDIEFLRGFGGEHGFAVTTVDALSDGDEVISSSRVRAALIAGDLSRANAFLGYPYFIDGWVEHGEKVGHRIGYPTANLAVTPGKCLPARGVYAQWVKAAGEWHMAATNVGYRPTFGGDRLTVEAFLLDFDGDLYRQRVRAAFVARLREERTYPGVEELTAQIALDVEETRRILGAQKPPQGL
jgi:riboflavin kinase / FMN adenylyltransferase